MNPGTLFAPFAGHPQPVFFAELLCLILTSEEQFRIPDVLEGFLQSAPLMDFRIPHIGVYIGFIRLSDEREIPLVHIDVVHVAGYLVINVMAEEVQIGAAHTVVGDPAPLPIGIGGRAAQFDERSILLLQIHQTLQQVEMLCLMRPVIIPLVQDSESALKFLGGDDRFPMPANVLRWDGDPIVIHHEPPSIEPVVERGRKVFGSRLAFTPRVIFHQRFSGTEAMSTGVQLFTDLGKGVSIGEQQLEGFPPEGKARWVGRNRMFVLRMFETFGRFQFRFFDFGVGVAIGCLKRPIAPIKRFNHGFAAALPGTGDFKLRDIEQHPDNHPGIGFFRHQAGIRGDTDFDTEIPEFIVSPQAFNVVASKAINEGNGDMRELTEAGIGE